MSGLGPLAWSELRIPLGVVWIDGKDYRDVGTWRLGNPGQPPGLQTAGGTTLLQRLPANRLAATQPQQSYQVAVQTKTEADFRLVSDLKTLSGPVRLFVAWEESSTWRIFAPAQDPTRTHFQLPYEIDHGLWTPTEYPSRAALVDHPDSPTPQGEVELTVIVTGVPAPGEIVVESTGRVVEVVTDDVSAEGPWRMLRLRYYPTRLVTLSDFSEELTAGGAHRVSFSFLDARERRTYRTTV
jgi:hypothetical protein